MSSGVVEVKVQKSVVNFGKQRYRAVSRFFVTVGHYRECRRYEPSRGVWGYSRPESFQIWRLRNSFFSTFHEICLRKNRPQIWKWQTILSHYNQNNWIKENKSIRRLHVSGSTGPGGGGSCPLADPLATALR